MRPSVEGNPILCLNSGSSSLKFALYHMGGRKEELLAQGAVERIGLDGGRLWVGNAEREILIEERGQFGEHRSAVRTVFGVLERLGLSHPSGVGHRLVHGGPEYSTPSRIGEELMANLRGLIPFAPLHLPDEIMCIEAVAAHFPDLPQVACFDTAFHRRMPEISQRLPISRHFWDEGIRRYGFHGLSYEYILSVLGDASSGRVIIAHLGNGASMAAVKNSQPMDTTMGFSPTGGFMMGTRSGDLDPGILFYLMSEKGYKASEIERLVNHESGLLGVSAVSSDMKTLLERRRTDPHVDQAVEMFCYHLRKTVGALAAVLEGLDLLVFTGGIGEKAAPVRQSVCMGLEYLGIELDPGLNESHADTITTKQSRCAVRVVPTKEDLMIARHTYEMLARLGGNAAVNITGKKGEWR